MIVRRTHHGKIFLNINDARVDLNNDGFVTYDEINQSINIIFQLIDLNKDNKITLEELEDLKQIVNILK